MTPHQRRTHVAKAYAELADFLEKLIGRYELSDTEILSVLTTELAEIVKQNLQAEMNAADR